MLRKGTVTILFCCPSVELLLWASSGQANKHQQTQFNCVRFVSFWVADQVAPGLIQRVAAEPPPSVKTVPWLNHWRLRKLSNKWRCMPWRWEILHGHGRKTTTRKARRISNSLHNFTMEKPILSQTHQTTNLCMANFSVCSRVRDSLLPQNGIFCWQSKTWHLKSFSFL